MTATEERQADAPCAHMTKELFLLSLECPARGWRLRRNGHKETPTPGDLMRMMEGQAVHRRARALYPDGVFAAIKGDSLARTRKLLADRSKRVLFEAAFEVGALTARSDILVRQEDGFHLIEVKSNSRLEVELLQDVGYTLMVLRRAGVRVVRASLLMISSEYRLGMPAERLFREVDCTTDATAWADLFDRVADSLDQATSGPECPSSPLARTCRDCPFYRTDCHAAGIKEHDILEIPRISNWKISFLANARVVRIADIPNKPGLLTTNQAIVRSAVIWGQPVVNEERLRSLLAQVRWPCAYLDFEAVATCIPLYESVAPYQSIPTQFSVHLSDRLGHVSAHREYLADHRRDCRRELAQQLCDDLDGARTIVVYSSYERTTMRALAALCPDLKDRLEGHAARLFDLERCCQAGTFYHPRFRGRSSIKATLPVLVPDFGYEGLNIADGDHATAMFAKMARGECSDEEVEKIRRDLLAYCAVDTLGMLKLHSALLEIANEANGH